VDKDGYVFVDKRSVTHADNRHFPSDDYNAANGQNTGGVMQVRVRKGAAAVAAAAAKRLKPSPQAPMPPPAATQSTMHRFLLPASPDPRTTLGGDTQDIDLTPGDGFDAQMADVIDLTGDDRADFVPTQPDDDLPPTQPYLDLPPTQPYGDLPPTQPYGDDIPPTQPDDDVDMG
jgi:hypothetical protein